MPDEEVDEAKTFHPNVDEDDPEIVFERGGIFKPKNINMAGTKKTLVLCTVFLPYVYTKLFLKKIQFFF